MQRFILRRILQSVLLLFVLALVIFAMILTGEVPSPIDPPSGCHFHPRCPLVMEQCSRVTPEAKAVAPGHQVACHLY